MKKIIALLLVLVMSLGLFAGCVEQPVEDPNLAAAKDYLYAMYKEEEGTKTTRNFDRVAVVRIDGTSYEIDWAVKVVSGDEGIVSVQKNEADKTVTIVVSEEVPNETTYELTATIKGQNGATETLTFNHIVPKVPTAAEILDMAYALESGKTLDGTYKLTGVITKIDTPWDDGYKNITVTIVCNGDESRPMMCYRLISGATTDASKLAVGDTITVEGKIKNYNGTVEFDAKCVLLKVVPGEGGEEKPVEGYDPTGKTAEEIVDAAYELEAGAAFTAPATLTGKVAAVNTAYSDQYKNVTVTIVIEGKEDKPIECFRMKGEGADVVKAGDTITVTGTIKNYNGKIEFDAGCTLDELVAGDGTDVPEIPENPSNPGGNTGSTDLSTPAGIVSAAFALADGEYLPQEVSLTGVVTKLGDVTSSNDRHVNFTVEGKDIYCYYLKGDVDKIQVGDTITVTGKIKNYKGTIEFEKAQLTAGGSGSGSQGGTTTPPVTSGEPACVTAPVIGKAYKLGLWQSNKSEVYYFTGVMSGYYGATSTDKAAGVDVYLEDAGNGNYHIYFMSGDTKTYLYGEQSGTHLNFKFGETKGVFTWDATHNTLKTTIGETVVFMGTYSNYDTFGMSSEDKIDTSYAGHLYE